MKLPLVSVVMPTYNVEKYVEEAFTQIKMGKDGAKEIIWNIVMKSNLT